MKLHLILPSPWSPTSGSLGKLKWSEITDIELFRSETLKYKVIQLKLSSDRVWHKPRGFVESLKESITFLKPMVLEKSGRKCVWKMPQDQKKNLQLNWPSIAFLGGMSDTIAKSAFNNYLQTLLVDLGRSLTSSPTDRPKMLCFVYGSGVPEGLAPEVEFIFSRDGQVDVDSCTDIESSEDERDPTYSTASQSTDSDTPPMNLRTPKSQVSSSRLYYFV